MSGKTEQSHQDDLISIQITPEKPLTDIAVVSKSGSPGKPAKKSKIDRAKRRRGKLRQMLDMPLDVIHEICGHLFPRDLLTLARTSKRLRHFFLTRNSLACWKAARSKIPGLPPCPDDLSEPQYANLMFESHCHRCLTRNCHTVYCIPELHAVLDPVNNDFNAADLEGLLSKRIPEYLEGRAERACASLAQLIREHIGLDASVDPFSLAIGARLLFKDKYCGSSMLLSSHLLRNTGDVPIFSKPDGVSSLYFDTALTQFGRQSVCSELAYIPALRRAKAVIAACDFDIETATVEELDRAEVRVQCKCNEHDCCVPIMTWRTAITNHRCNPEPIFTPATEAQMAAAKPLEHTAQEYSAEVWNETRAFSCRHSILKPSKDDWEDTHIDLFAPCPVYLITQRCDSLAEAKYLRDGIAVRFENG